MDELQSVLPSAQSGAGQQAASGLLFGMSLWGIVALLAFSGLGLVYVRYGKTTNNTAMLCCGIALLGYSYFLSDTTWIILAGAALAAWPHIARKLNI